MSFTNSFGGIDELSVDRFNNAPSNKTFTSICSPKETCFGLYDTERLVNFFLV